MRIVVTDPIFGVPEKYIDAWKQLGAEVYKDVPEGKEEVIRRFKTAEILIPNYVDVTPEIIDAAPNLKHIVSPAVGYEWIDVKYAASKGITVSNCPTFVPLAVGEHALALIFALAKRLIDAPADLQSGIWDPNAYRGVELAGKKLGLVGHGNIAKHLERMAAALGMTTIYVDSKSSDDELDELLKASDIVCLCLPLNDKTRHIIDERRLKLLKKSAFLINMARGAIIDQKALIASLKRGDFAGAGLDVFEGEPPAHGKPSDEILELVNLPNVIATPHSAFNTPETLERKGAEILANIEACIAGKPINVVN